MPPSVTAGFNSSMGKDGFRSRIEEIKVKTDLSIAAADDVKTIEYLEEEFERYQSKKEEKRVVDLGVNAHLNDGKKPWELPQCFVKKGPTIPWSTVNRRRGKPLQQGWTPAKGTLSAIRNTATGQKGSGLIGMKNVLEFCLKDTKKTGWIMVEYCLLREIEGDVAARIVDDELVLCKVFHQKRPGLDCPEGGSEEVPNQVSSHDHDLRNTSLKDKSLVLPEEVPIPLQAVYEQLPPILEKDDMESLMQNEVRSSGSGLEEPASREEQQTKKRKVSKVWEYFAKIKTKDEMAVYAACHCCNKMFRAHPKSDGTKNLMEHAKMCIGSHLQRHSVQAPCNAMDTGDPMDTGEGERIGVPVEPTLSEWSELATSSDEQLLSLAAQFFGIPR